MTNFGILNINKPKGMTSHDVVSRLRKILNMKQIGHTGTLDPIAQGVLPICVGKATRIIEYLSTGKKYRAFATLGIATNTYDTEGEILSSKEVSTTKQKVQEALLSFQGQIEQTPPAFSAIKIKGKKLYEYARKGESIEAPKRQVTINKIELVEFKEKKQPEIIFDVDCSGGTYIRSIIHDLGLKLNCGAVMTNLIRTESSGFEIKDAIQLEEVSTSNIANPLHALSMPKISITSAQLDEIRLGRSFPLEYKLGTVALVLDDQLVSIANSDGEFIHPKKVLV